MSAREGGRGQPAKEAPGQTAAVVKDDAARDGLTIWKHSSLIAQQESRRDMRLRRGSLLRRAQLSRVLRNKKARDEPAPLPRSI
jgi:hypothetical protein